MKKYEKYKKENPFKVPENYFEEFPKKIRTKIKMDVSKGVKKSRLMIFSPYITIAASFLILYGLWFLFLEKGFLNGHLSIDNKATTITEMDYFLEELNQEELIEIFISNDTSDPYNIAYNEEDIANILEDIDESLIIESL